MHVQPRARADVAERVQVGRQAHPQHRVVRGVPLARRATGPSAGRGRRRQLAQPGGLDPAADVVEEGDPGAAVRRRGGAPGAPHRPVRGTRPGRPGREDRTDRRQHRLAQGVGSPDQQVAHAGGLDVGGEVAEREVDPAPGDHGHRSHPVRGEVHREQVGQPAGLRLVGDGAHGDRAAAGGVDTEPAGHGSDVGVAGEQLQHQSLGEPALRLGLGVQPDQVPRGRAGRVAQRLRGVRRQRPVALGDPDRAEDLVAGADRDGLPPAGLHRRDGGDVDHVVAAPQLAVDAHLPQPLAVCGWAVLVEHRLVPDEVVTRLQAGRGQHLLLGAEDHHRPADGGGQGVGHGHQVTAGAVGGVAVEPCAPRWTAGRAAGW